VPGSTLNREFPEDADDIRRRWREQPGRGCCSAERQDKHGHHRDSEGTGWKSARQALHRGIGRVEVRRRVDSFLHPGVQERVALQLLLCPERA
jgi:hypothetical protein